MKRSGNSLVRCDADNCPATICGGPHSIITDSDGNDIIFNPTNPDSAKLAEELRKKKDT